MKIREVELREIHLRLRERFEISTGGWDERRILLLRMESEEGEAWSECVAAEAPNYSYETPETAWHILTEYVLPAVVGRRVRWTRGRFWTRCPGFGGTPWPWPRWRWGHGLWRRSETEHLSGFSPGRDPDGRSGRGERGAPGNRRRTSAAGGAPPGRGLQEDQAEDQARTGCGHAPEGPGRPSRTRPSWPTRIPPTRWPIFPS